MTTTHAGGADTVRALVRGARTALYEQLAVAVITLIITIGALVTLNNARQQLGVAEGARDEALKQRNAADADVVKLRASAQDLLRGRDALVGGRFDAAVASLSDAANAFPNDGVAWSLLAQALHGQHNDAQAVSAMQKSLSIPVAADAAPSFADYARLATYQCGLHDGAGAASTVRTAPDGFAAALQQDPNLTEVRTELNAACAAAGADLAMAAPVAGAVAASAGDAEATQPFAIKLVFLHIRSEADRADAERLRQALIAAHFRVPGIELVPRTYGPNLRYYYAPQAAQAHTIAQLVSGQLHELGIAGWSDWTPREVSLAGAYDNLPRDRVEVWLPPRGAN